jgi:hypothetical protein
MSGVGDLAQRGVAAVRRRAALRARIRIDGSASDEAQCSIANIFNMLVQRCKSELQRSAGITA